MVIFSAVDGGVLGNSGVVSLCAAAFVACFSAVNLGMSRLSAIVGSRSAFVLSVHVTSWLSSASGTRLARLTSAGSRKFCLRLLGCQPGCATVYCRLKIRAHFRGLVLEYFLTKNCHKSQSISSILLNLPF